ncbi:hypothetical protein C8J57DRAFT_1226713 [Mycena rebaudengoi]|nr:hypothetical protein C8J57DRAFT_1226713 [Mycena rebaudengoi]
MLFICSAAGFHCPAGCTRRDWNLEDVLPTRALVTKKREEGLFVRAYYIQNRGVCCIIIDTLAPCAPPVPCRRRCAAHRGTIVWGVESPVGPYSNKKENETARDSSGATHAGTVPLVRHGWDEGLDEDRGDITCPPLATWASGNLHSRAPAPERIGGADGTKLDEQLGTLWAFRARSGRWTFIRTPSAYTALVGRGSDGTAMGGGRARRSRDEGVCGTRAVFDQAYVWRARRRWRGSSGISVWLAGWRREARGVGRDSRGPCRKHSGREESITVNGCMGDLERRTLEENLKEGSPRIRDGSPARRRRREKSAVRGRDGRMGVDGRMGAGGGGECPWRKGRRALVGKEKSWRLGQKLEGGEPRIRDGSPAEGVQQDGESTTVDGRTGVGGVWEWVEVQKRPWEKGEAALEENLKEDSPLGSRRCVYPATESSSGMKPGEEAAREERREKKRWRKGGKALEEKRRTLGRKLEGVAPGFETASWTEAGGASLLVRGEEGGEDGSDGDGDGDEGGRGVDGSPRATGAWRGGG